jgi:hypothetical protein
MSMVCNVTVRQLHHHAYEVCSSTELHGHVCQGLLVAHNEQRAVKMAAAMA